MSCLLTDQRRRLRHIPAAYSCFFRDTVILGSVRKILGAEGTLFSFGVKSRKLGRRRPLVFHSEEARGATGALREYWAR